MDQDVANAHLISPTAPSKEVFVIDFLGYMSFVLSKR
jgi:hypothetical protein